MEQAPLPPPSIPICRKQKIGKDWHREHVRRQRYKSRTEPQNTNWQWPVWSGWQGGNNSNMVKEERFSSSPQNGRPAHSRSRNWNATRLREMKHHTARMFFIALMHCALARISVSSPQLYFSSDFSSVISDRKVIPCH